MLEEGKPGHWTMNCEEKKTGNCEVIGCKCNSGGEKQLAKLATSLTPAVTHKRKMD